MADAWTRHPLAVAALAAICGAIVAGTAAIVAADRQAKAEIDAARMSLPKPPPVDEATLEARPVSHRVTITYGDTHTVTVLSGFKDHTDYRIRFEGCYTFPSNRDNAVCAFTLKAKDTITVTNVENASHASRQDGSVVDTCCLFASDSEDGAPIISGPKQTGDAVIQRTFSPPEVRTFLLKVPKYNARGALDAILFSRGEGDPGVTFPAYVRTVN